MDQPSSTATLKYPLRVLLCIIGYTSYITTLAVFACIGAPFFILIGALKGPMRKLMYVTLRVYSFLLTRVWLPFLQIYSVVEISGYKKHGMKQAIFVANHRSRIDIHMLLSILPDCGVIIKSKYANMPVYSSFVKYLDFVSVNPASLSSLAIARERCMEIIDIGRSFCVFPEGTRAKTGNLLAFRDFAFRLAVEKKLPVVPIVIHSELPFMANTPQSIFPRRKFKFVIRFLDPVFAEENEKASDLAYRTRAIIAHEIAKLDQGTYWEIHKK